MNLAVLDRSLVPPSDRVTTIGLGRLMRMAYEGANLAPLLNVLLARVQADPTDAPALMDLSTILMLTGQREQGLQLQAAALALSPLYRRPHGRADGLKLLAFVVGGDFMANTPLDFLLDGSDVELHLLHVGPGRALPAEVPEHDLAFLAIAESGDNRAVLAGLRQVVAAWPRPVFNGAPERIAALSRDGLCALFAGDPLVLVPPSPRVPRAALEAVRDGGLALAALLPGEGFPIIARPVDSHAGTGLAKLDGPAELAAYLAARAEAVFYISPFIAYRSADGLYRKQRIAFVRGLPFASHMAVSEHWMVHYLNAGMDESADKRADEARFMANFDSDFAPRHRAAFERLCQKVGLDYFAIDCAELPDGRLLLFEADVAMIVHALDAEAVYPYKKPAMARLFAGFQAALEAAAG